MAGYRNGFAKKIDILKVGAVGNKDSITICSNIDPCLDGGLVGRDIDDLRNNR